MPKVTKNYNPSFTSKRSNNEIVKLAKKGDSITIRIADYPNYYGQHWLDAEKKYVPCPRVNSPDLNNPEFCGYCEDFSRGNKDMKAKVSFVFQAVDRKTHKAIFFETSQMVWTEMVNAEKKGIKIFDYDWLIERTENKPKYYEITRLEKEPLDELDQKAMDEAKTLDTEALVKFRLERKKKDLEEPPKGGDEFETYVNSVSEDVEANAPEDLPF